MKRSFALIGFTYFVSLMAAIYLGYKAAFFLAIVLFCLFAVSLIFKNIRVSRSVPVMFLTACVAFSYYTIAFVKLVEPVEMLEQKDAVIQGTICEVPYKAYNRYYYVLETDYIGVENAPQNKKIRLSSASALDADLYDRVTSTVHMFLPPSGEGFSSRTYYASKGIHLFGYLDEYKEITVEHVESKPFYYYIAKARQDFLSRIRQFLPQDQASLAGAMLLGGKDGLSEQITSDFRRIGVSHLLAVSGMHTAVIIQTLMMLFAFFKVPKRLSCGLTILGVLLFMGVTGFVPSVMRAGIMSIIYLLATMFYRQADSINSLGLAVFLLTIFNPFSAGDLGLILSVAATLGILLFERPLRDFMCSKLPQRAKLSALQASVVSTISMSIAASVLTLPITMVSFGSVSVIFLLSNLLLIFPSTVFILCTAFLIIFSYAGIFSFLAYPFALIAGVLANYMGVCAHLLAKIPFASVSTRQPFLLLWLAGVIVLFALAFCWQKNFELTRISAWLSVIVLLAGIFSYQLCRRNVTTLSVLDVGDGLSLVLHKNGHSAMLSCGGEKSRSSAVSDYLDAHNLAKIDYLLLSDAADESARYAGETIESYKTGTMLISSDDKAQNLVSTNIEKCEKVVNFAQSAETELWDNVKIWVEKQDDTSFIYIKVNDITMLVPSGGADLSSVPEKWANCDFLITQEIPKDRCGVSSAYTVLSLGEETLQKNTNSLAALHDQKILSTTGDGNVAIDFFSGSRLSIRRE